MSPDTIVGYLAKLCLKPYQLMRSNLLFPGVRVEYYLDGTARIVRKGASLSASQDGIGTSEVVKILRTYEKDKFIPAPDLLNTLESLGFSAYLEQNWSREVRINNSWFKDYKIRCSDSGSLDSHLSVYVEITHSEVQEQILESISVIAKRHANLPGIFPNGYDP